VHAACVRTPAFAQRSAYSNLVASGMLILRLEVIAVARRIAMWALMKMKTMLVMVQRMIL